MFQQGPIDGPTAAFRNQHVVAIVDELVRERDANLVKFSKLAILDDMRPLVDTKLALLARANPNLIPAGHRVAAAGAALNKEAAPGALRGAVLERLVHELLRSRGVSALREQKVRLTVHTRTNRHWSNPKDVVADEATPEVYECKRKPGHRLDQDDLHELADIADGARHQRGDCRATVAVLDRRSALRSAVRGLTVELDLVYWVPWTS